MKQIKQLIFSTVIALVSIVNSATAQSISAQPDELQTGGQTELVVSLTGATTMTALQFNLQLPVGMTARASSVILGPATNGHTFSVQVLDSGDMLFVIYSMDLKTFCDGELLRIPVNACNNEVNATGQFYNVRTATDKAVSHQCDNTSFSVKVTGTIYNLIYIVDGKEYKTYELANGATITPEPAPTKEGYTFSGWSEIPETMPAHDVTVTGTFSINKYKLTYTVDGEEYKTYEVEYGDIISPEAAPTKEGYTFSGWSEIPETMPAHDVTVTGTFSINKYKLTYTVDGEEYKTYEVEFGANITPEATPTKEGYTFSGWSEIPETMPAHDVTVTGTFTANNYKLIYTVDGTEYKICEVEYGATITPEAEPIKEGYTFSGWSEIPETMPAHDVTVTGTFSINKYKLTYVVDGAEYKTYEIEYGTAITLEAEPTKEGYTFSGWSEIPETMPAHDVVVYASYTSGIIEVLMASQHNVRIYSPNGKKLNKLQKGINIIILDDGIVKKVVMR